MSFRQGEALEQIYFRFRGAAAVVSPLAMEALLPLLLVPAMKLRSPLRFDSPISRQLLAGAKRFQEIFSVWYPDFQPVEIHAEAVEAPVLAPVVRGAGVFFSGGVDSSYSLLKHRGELTHAIFLHGCDIPLENTSYRETTVSRLAETAEGCGVTLVEVETNLLHFSDQFCHWGKHYHGSAMAAVAMLLSGTLSKVYVASSTSYSRIVPFGSTLVTDPLWSTAPMEIIYDGAEQERLGKIQAVARSPVALRNLRVCFGTPDGGYNCGSCEKCFRTMVGLRICGALDQCTAFDKPLDLLALKASPEVLAYFTRLRSWTINRQAAMSMGTDPELILALDDLFRRASFVGLVHALAGEKWAIVSSPHWRDNLPKFRTALLQSLREEDPEWFAEKILSWLPSVRDRALIRLADDDRPWFKRSFWRYRLRRLLAQVKRR